MHRFLPILVVLVCFPTVVQAGPADLSEILDPIRNEQQAPGLAAAVLRDGKVVAIGAVGLRKAGNASKLSIDDKFHIGSCTMAMTATLAAMMVDEGRLQWDSTVGDLLGEAGKQYEMDDGWADVTLELLLSHRGGAPADLPTLAFATRGQDTANARKMVVRAILKAEPAEPDKFVFSNSGYVLAGAMLEQAAGGRESWEQLMHKRLFKPLGIKSAGFGAPGLPGEVDQPRGHTPTTQPLEPMPWSDNPLAIGPAGTVHMTLADWLKFVALHIRGGRADEHEQDNHDLLGISPDTFNDYLHRATKGDGRSYSFGWIIARSRLAGVNVLAHDGSNTYWYATVWASPKLNMGVVVACNQGSPNASRACHAAMEAILKQQLKAIEGK